MEQLLIFLLVAVASVVSNALQKKKKKEQERADAAGEKRPLRPGSPPPLSPIPHWPRTAKNWQEELERLLETHAPQTERTRPIPPVLPQPPAPQPSRMMVPPSRRSSEAPLILAPAPGPIPVRAARKPLQREVISSTPLRDSASAYLRASRLDSQVGTRLQAVEKETENAKPSPVAGARNAFSLPTNAPPTQIVRWAQSRRGVREAFIASLIFGQPKGLEGIGGVGASENAAWMTTGVDAP
jgi:hypothetical protein